jgi:hypothetical protein
MVGGFKPPFAAGSLVQQSVGEAQLQRGDGQLLPLPDASQLWYKKPPAGYTRIIGFTLEVPDAASIR